MNIIITGHKGFLGNRVVNRLKTTHNLLGISRTIGGSDIKEFCSDQIDEIKFEPEAIVMCHAAVSSGIINIETNDLYASNVEFTSKVLSRFPDCYVLYISSISVYGNQINIDETTIPEPKTEYSISKTWGELLVAKSKNYSILRLSSLYGIGMKENTIIPNYIKQALKNGVIQVWGNGTRSQNYLHVEDAVSYIETILTNRKIGIYIGASKNSISNLELAEVISSITNSKIEFCNEDNSQSVFIDNSLTRGKLKVKESIDFKKGLAELITWKQKQY